MRAFAVLDRWTEAGMRAFARLDRWIDDQCQEVSVTPVDSDRMRENLDLNRSVCLHVFTMASAFCSYAKLFEEVMGREVYSSASLRQQLGGSTVRKLAASTLFRCIETLEKELKALATAGRTYLDGVEATSAQRELVRDGVKKLMDGGWKYFYQLLPLLHHHLGAAVRCQLVMATAATLLDDELQLRVFAANLRAKDADTVNFHEACRLFCYDEIDTHQEKKLNDWTGKLEVAKGLCDEFCPTFHRRLRNLCCIREIEPNASKFKVPVRTTTMIKLTLRSAVTSLRRNAPFTLTTSECPANSNPDVKVLPNDTTTIPDDEPFSPTERTALLAASEGGGVLFSSR